MPQSKSAMLQRKRAGFIDQAQNHRVAKQSADALQPPADGACGHVKNLRDLAMAKLVLERQLNEQLLLRLEVAGALKQAARLRACVPRLLCSEDMVDALLIDEGHSEPPR